MVNLLLSMLVLLLALDAFSSGRQTVGLLYNSKDDSISTSNGVENHVKKGIELALKDISKKKVEINTEWVDVGETAESTLKIAGLLATKNFDFIIGPSSSFQVQILAQLIKDKKLKTKIISPTATSDELLKFDNVFLISNVNSVQAKLIVKEADIKDKQTVLVVNIKDCTYCSNLAQFIESELTKAKLTYKSIELFESDLANPIKYAARKSYDHIFIPALEGQTAEVIRSLWPENASASYWGCDGVGTLGRFITQLPFAKKLKINWLSHYHKDIVHENNEAFVKEYYQKYQIFPIDTSAFNYEAVLFATMNLILDRKYNKFVTGEVTVSKNTIIRKMPVLFLSDAEVKFKHLVGL